MKRIMLKMVSIYILTIFNFLILIFSFNIEIKDDTDEVVSYREVSEMSEITQESYPAGYIIS